MDKEWSSMRNMNGSYCYCKSLINVLIIIMAIILQSCFSIESLRNETGIDNGVFEGPAESEFNDLKQGEIINDFQVLSLYRDHRGKTMGGRFIHIPTRMPLDILNIDTIPQMLFVVSTLAESDKGEAHTGEHLVLGKGSKGAQMSLAMEMMLGKFSAATSQDVTAYHFNTSSGKETFFDLMHSFLDTIINPDFSEEEIRREVCHLGVSLDPQTKQLFLDEKGTIYNEMKSSSEKPFFHAWRINKILLYGENHPLSYVSGGLPEKIRDMTPNDIFSFHHNRYQFGPTTNGVVVVPSDFPLIDVLTGVGTNITSIMSDSAYKNKHGHPPQMPEFKPVNDHESIRIEHYPGKFGLSDGFAYLSWGPYSDISFEEILTLELIFELLAEGESSYLYNDLINSQTRQINPGPTKIVPFTYHIDGYPIFLYLGGMSQETINETYLSSLRKIVEDRIVWLVDLPDNSDELKVAHSRFQTLLNSRLRQLRKRVEDNPGFGNRGTSIWWYRYLKNLNRNSEFEHDLIPDDYFKNLQQKIVSGQNFYGEYLKKFKIVQKPYIVSALPSEEMMIHEKHEKLERMRLAKQHLLQQYNTQDEQVALANFSEDIDRKTKELDERDSKIPRPSFTNNPPLVYDTGIEYDVEHLANNVPCVWNYFDSLSFHNIGFRLYQRDFWL